MAQSRQGTGATRATVFHLGVEAVFWAILVMFRNVLITKSNAYISIRVLLCSLNMIKSYMFRPC
jgi:hypothetical protein